jgi:ParB-like chromosome segregation protein Spo0J
LLLDGHLRLEAIKDLGQNEVLCLISTDDEAFTYNHKVSYLSSIQEHFMILKAIKNGVSEERIAKTLNVDVIKIREKRNLLEGICPEAIDLLKDKQISPNALKVLKKVLAMRQIELAELMVAANNYTVPYAKALLAATPSNQLIEQDKKKRVEGLSQEEMARMEKEMNRLEKEFKAVEESYGPNVLNLVVARRYLTNLLDNARVSRFLSQNYSEVLTEFQKIIEATSLES